VDSRIYVDGRITTPDEAVVPALDRGFLFGDSVYEVLWWHRGVLVQKQEHFDRLRRSAEHLYMEVTNSDAELDEAIRRTVEATGADEGDDAYVRLVVTRGSGALGLGFREDVEPGLVVIVAPADRPDEATWDKGLTMAVVHRRRNPRLALDPRAKTGNYLNNVLALHEARLAGADDAIMLNEAGEVAEATTSNVYAIVDDRLVTPPLDAGILEGTTRMRILALCETLGIAAEETVLLPAELLGAAEVFISSSVRGILPVLAIDGRPIGEGRPGPLTRRIRAAFEAAADEDAERARLARGLRTGSGDTP
jgi:branched-chain amino acid aminotransferase